MGVDYGFIQRHRAAMSITVGQNFTLMADYDNHKTAICDFVITRIWFNKFGDEVVSHDNGTCCCVTLRSLAINHIIDGGWRMEI